MTIESAVEQTKLISETAKILQQSLAKIEHSRKVIKDWRYTVFIDAGHGGINESGQYQTISGGKKFFHKGVTLHRKGWFFEGVSNRAIAKSFEKKLTAIGMPFEKIYHPMDDWKISERLRMANHFHANEKKGFGISIHSNASKAQKGSGFECFAYKNETGINTSAGQARQASRLYNDKCSHLGLPNRGAKYKNWQILADSDMKFTLWEFLFFDMIEEAKLLMRKDIQDLFASLLVDFCIWSQHTLEL